MIDEMIVHPILLARAHDAGGVGDADLQLLVLLPQGLQQAGLARTGRGGENEQGTLRHLTLPICFFIGKVCRPAAHRYRQENMSIAQ